MCVGTGQQRVSLAKSSCICHSLSALITCAMLLVVFAPAWTARGADVDLPKHWADRDWVEEFVEGEEWVLSDAEKRENASGDPQDGPQFVKGRGSFFSLGSFRPSLRFGVLEQRVPFAPPVSGSLRQWLYSLEVEFAFALFRAQWAQFKCLLGGGVVYPTRIREGMGRLLSESAGNVGFRLTFQPDSFRQSDMSWSGAWWVDVLAGKSHMQYPRHTLSTFDPVLRLGYKLVAPRVMLSVAQWSPQIELSGRHAGWLASYDTQEVLPLDRADAAFADRSEVGWSRSGRASLWSVEVRLAAAEVRSEADSGGQGGGDSAGSSSGSQMVGHLFGLFAGFTESRYEDLLESFAGQGSKSSYRQVVSFGVFWGAQ